MKDYFGYKSKKCIVTGASSGIGKAVCEMLVDMGAEVYALDLNECNVKGIKEFKKVNLTDKKEIDETFKNLPEKIDSFFGVAGLSGAKTDYITTFNCDYTSNFYITEKYLKERMSEGSSILYVSSTAGLNWKKYKKEQDRIVNLKTWEEVEAKIKEYNKYSGTMAYMYAKRCISQYAAEKSVELGKRRIRVNCVMPGSTNTGMKDEFEKMAGGKEALLDETGVAHRLATSEEMAGPIVFLNSDMASFVSGVDFCVDASDHVLKELNLKKDRENISATNKIILSLATKMTNK